MRTGAPIYTTEAILDETGFEMEVKEDGGDETEEGDDTADSDVAIPSGPRLENYAIEELEKTLSKLIEREEYEEAARVAAILKAKREKQ